jgi:hypothetical protein
LRTVRASHTATFRATVLTTYQDGVSPTGTTILIEGGDVVLDATAQVRGTLSLLTDGNGWDPRPGRSLLLPYGNEIYIERGIDVGGSLEWVGQGFYRISSVAQASAPDGQLTVTGSDRSQGIIDAALPVPVQFAATASVADVFSTLVLQVYPDATIDFDYTASADLLGSAQVTTEDRYQFLADLATSRGKVMYWDYQGHLVVKDRPDPGVTVWDVSAGEDGVLIDAARTLTRDNVFNAVVVTADGADTSAAPLAVAYDNNPESPTYYYGTFGKIPEFWSSPLVTTAAQAQAAAALILARAITLPLQADFSSVPNPALEPLDAVSLTYPGPVAPDSLVIGQITIPLTAADPLTASAYDPSALEIAISGDAG